MELMGIMLKPKKLMGISYSVRGLVGLKMEVMFCLIKGCLIKLSRWSVRVTALWL